MNQTASLPQSWPVRDCLIKLFTEAKRNSFVSPGDGVLAQAVVQVHVVEGADAASQLALLPDLPGDEQGTENDKIQMKLETRVTHEKKIIPNCVLDTFKQAKNEFQY